MSGKAVNVAISGIVIAPNCMRRLRPEVVSELAESIAAQGLLQPIVLRPRGAANF